MPSDARAHLPLKPVVFQLLVALLDGDRHGWALLRSLDRDGGGPRLMPGQLYRHLDAMAREGLIDERAAGAETGPAPARLGGAPPKRFFRLTPLGRAVTRAEAQRLAGLVADARVRRLLARGRP